MAPVTPAASSRRFERKVGLESAGGGDWRLVARQVMLDSICTNELADPDELVVVSSDNIMAADNRCCPKDRSLADWRDIRDMKLLNLVYDLTPSDLIVLVVTELGYLPPSSVPVVIREYRKEVTL